MRIHSDHCSLSVVGGAKLLISLLDLSHAPCANAHDTNPSSSSISETFGLKNYFWAISHGMEFEALSRNDLFNFGFCQWWTGWQGQVTRSGVSTAAMVIDNLAHSWIGLIGLEHGPEDGDSTLLEVTFLFRKQKQSPVWPDGYKHQCPCPLHGWCIKTYRPRMLV